MRLIDADAVIEKKWQAESEACFYALEDVVSVTDIEEAPSIDVVFCKECKFWIGHISDDDGFDEGLDECRWRDSEAPDADDFCSYGERKTNAD